MTTATPRAAVTDAEVGRLRHELALAQARERAVASVLRALNRSPGDVAGALGAIAERAAALCDAQGGGVVLTDGEAQWHAAAWPPGRSEAVGVPVSVTRPARATPLGDMASFTSRVLREGRTLHVADMQGPEGDPYAANTQSFARRVGTHAYLAAPMLRDGRVLGYVGATRTVPGPFTDDQVRLLEAFADQAVIALENARLFGELQERLAEQTATSDVLRLISESPTALEYVLDGIAERAARLSATDDVQIFLREKTPEGDAVRIAAFHGPEGRGSLGLVVPIRPGHIPFAAVAQARTVHVPDIMAEPDASRFPGSRALVEQSRRHRSFLAVPLLENGVAVGLIHARRAEVRPFAEGEIQLLETFAAQAVIAIRNARLFSDLQQRTAELGRAVEEQKALAEVGRAVGSSLDVGEVLTTILVRAVELSGADSGSIFEYDRSTRSFLARASHREPDEVVQLMRGRWVPIDSEGTVQAAGRTRAPAFLEDVAPDNSWTGIAGTVRPALTKAGLRASMGVPLLRGEELLGVLLVRRREPGRFPAETVKLLETLASQSAVALHNARLFTEVGERLAEQTATAEVLRVIASSPTDVRRVLDAVAESASRLCGSDDAVIWQTEGGAQRVAAQYGALPPPAAFDWESYPTPSPLARVLAEGRTLHLADAAGEYPGTPIAAHGIRALLGVPLLRAGEAVGAIVLRRTEAGPFTEDQVALLETFASQAAIAIANARLFSELEESNATLKQALEQQTATSEVLRAIASSPTNVGAVLQSICETASRLLGGVRHATLWLYEGDQVRRAARTTDDAFAPPLHPVGEVRAISDVGTDMREGWRRDPASFVVPDIEAEATAGWPTLRENARAAGWRSAVFTPLLRTGECIGYFAVGWREASACGPERVALLERFADQAVIAIENSRLFSELRERDERRRQELERASSIQQRLLPETVEGWPGVLEIAVRFRPAVETSGDFYDVLPLTPAQAGDPPPLQLAVGDVAGKGMSAALVTALARSALRATSSVPTRMAVPAATLREAGARLHRDVGSGHFVACALAVVEPPGLLHAGPRIRLSNAAQVPVLLVRRGAATELEAPGDRLPLGARPDGDYKDVEADLRPGDVVVFSSDGMVEAPSLAGAAVGSHLAQPAGAGELLGFARLAASAAHWSSHAGTAEEVAAGIWSDLTAWCGEESHHDDVTLLVLRVPVQG